MRTEDESNAELRAINERHAKLFPTSVERERNQLRAEVADLRRRLDDAESDAEQFAQRLEDAQSVSTDNVWLQQQHAAYHDMPGNLLGKRECFEVRCDFWDAAAWVVGPALAALARAEQREARVRKIHRRVGAFCACRPATDYRYLWPCPTIVALNEGDTDAQ